MMSSAGRGLQPQAKATCQGPRSGDWRKERITKTPISRRQRLSMCIARPSWARAAPALRAAMRLTTGSRNAPRPQFRRGRCGIKTTPRPCARMSSRTGRRATRTHRGAAERAASNVHFQPLLVSASVQVAPGSAVRCVTTTVGPRPALWICSADGGRRRSTPGRGDGVADCLQIAYFSPA